MHSESLLQSDSAPRRRDVGLEKLLQESQAQVRELLPHREESARLGAELSIAKEILASREDEVKKLQAMLLSERSDRQKGMKHLSDEHSHRLDASEQRSKKLEDQLAAFEEENAQLSRELERKSKMVKSLEEEIVLVRQQRTDERGKLLQKDAALVQLENERNRAVTQGEEVARANVKLEQSKKALEQQIASLREEGEALRGEMDQLRRQKSELYVQVTQISSQRDALQDRNDSLSREMQQVHSLRQSLTQMEQYRGEAVLLRDAVESTDSTLNNERSARRTIEAERDQLLLKVRGLEMDVRRLEADCHRAQCDGAERSSLKRENDELRTTVEHSGQSIAELQEALSKTRSECSAERMKLDYFVSTMTREVNLLRTAVESRVSDALVRSVNPSASEASMGLVPDRPNGLNGHSSTILNGASPIHLAGDSTNISSSFAAPTTGGLKSAHRLSNDVPSRGEVQRQVDQLLYALKVAVMESNQSVQEDTARRGEIMRQLETEQQRNSELEAQVARLQSQLTQKQLDLANLERKESYTSQQWKLQLEECHRLDIRIREQLASLRAALQFPLAVDDASLLHEVSFVTLRSQTSMSASDEASQQPNFETILQAVHEIVRLTEQQRREKKDLEVEVDRCHKLHAETIRQHSDAIDEIEKRSKRQLQEVYALNERQTAESSRMHLDLRAACQLSVQRFEELSSEHQQLQARLQQSLQDSAETEAILQRAKQDLEKRRQEISQLSSTLHTERLQRAELQSVTEETSEALKKAKELIASHEATNAQYVSSVDLLVKGATLLSRYVFGMNETITTLCLERSWAMQFARALEASLYTVLAECPKRGKGVPRFSSLRPVVIAVIAGRRLQSMYFLRRHQPNSQRSPLRARGGGQAPPTESSLDDVIVMRAGVSASSIRNTSHGANNGRRVALPALKTVSPKVLLAVLQDEPQSNARDFLSRLLTVMEINSAAPLNVQERKSFELMWLLSAGLSGTRNSLQIGITGYARATAATLRQQLRLMAESQQGQERNLQSLRGEVAALTSMVRMKEDQLSSYAIENKRLQEEKREMVDRRRLEFVETALAQAKGSLEQEKERHRMTEDRVAQLLDTEALLLSRQADLQNESRSLAIELARKTAAISTAHSRTSQMLSETREIAPETGSRGVPTDVVAAQPRSEPDVSDGRLFLRPSGTTRPDTLFVHRRSPSPPLDAFTVPAAHRDVVLDALVVSNRRSPRRCDACDETAAPAADEPRRKMPLVGPSRTVAQTNNNRKSHQDIMSLIHGIDEKISTALYNRSASSHR